MVVPFVFLWSQGFRFQAAPHPNPLPVFDGERGRALRNAGEFQDGAAYFLLPVSGEKVAAAG